jgi:hypothetical protein
MIAPSMTTVPVTAFTITAVAAAYVAVAAFIQGQPTKPIHHASSRSKSLARIRAAADRRGRSHLINAPPMPAGLAQPFIPASMRSPSRQSARLLPATRPHRTLKIPKSVFE